MKLTKRHLLFNNGTIESQVHDTSALFRTFMHKSIYFLGILILCTLSFKSYSIVYKCTGEDGSLKYQSVKCPENSKTKVMDISKYEAPIVEVKNKPNNKRSSTSGEYSEEKKQSNINALMNERSTKRKLNREKANICKSLRNKYKSLASKERNICRKNLETSCHRRSAHELARSRWSNSTKGISSTYYPGPENNYKAGRGKGNRDARKMPAKPRIIKVNEDMKKKQL